MSKILIRILAIIGAFTLALGFACAVVVGFAMLTKKGVPSKTIIEVDLSQDVEEVDSASLLSRMASGRQASLRNIVDAIDRGAKDDRVVGLVAKMGASLSMVKAQEIRDALARFKAHKKWTVAYADSFGEFAAANSSYYLATAFDEIYIQPSGEVGLTGVALEVPFLKGTLDKLGVQYKGEARYEYKNAPNTFTQTQFTATHKEAFQGITTAWMKQMKKGVCDARKISSDSCETLANNGPYLGADALKLRLVDGFAYRDEVYARVRKKAGEGAELLYLEKYLERAGRPHSSGHKIALIYGVGNVVRGPGNFSVLDGNDAMGAESVAAAFRAAIDDEEVKAIVFRIDSPGGSYVGSDMVWREVKRAREAKKPVIATFGSVAASGGYFVAMGATKIVAHPATITGSIGVFAGKMVTADFWQKLGVSFDEVHEGENATLFSGAKDFTPQQYQKLNAWLDHVYVDFTDKVGQGRKLSKEQVDKIARGRIWSGEDAKNLGLVDELGGYATAYKLAKSEAKISAEDEIDVVVFPKPKSVWARLFNFDEYDNSDEEGARVESSIIEQLRPAARVMKVIQSLDSSSGGVVAPLPAL